MEIKYRLATDKDYPAIVNLCERNNLDVPLPGNLNFVAEQKSKIKGNKIVGLISLKIKDQIDGLIADNPLIANTLVKMLEGVIISKGIPEVCGFGEPSLPGVTPDVLISPGSNTWNPARISGLTLKELL